MEGFNDLTLKELTEAMISAKSRKTVRNDSINMKLLLKYKDKVLHSRLAHLCMCWTGGEVPQQEQE